MKRFFKFASSCIVFFIIPQCLFWASGESFEDYEKRTIKECADKPWTNTDEWGGNIMPIPQYPKLDKSAIEKAIVDIEKMKTSPEELQRIQSDIEKLNSESEWIFKTLEISRITYRAMMNGVFWCAVVQSRQNMRNSLLKKIEEKYPAANTSEIQEKLKREWERLDAQAKVLSCIPISGETETPSAKRVVNSAINQYCHYNSYLLYLRSNLDNNNAEMLNLDASINVAKETTTSLPQNSSMWAREIAGRDEAIRNEILRANSVLPRAIEAFREMERSYSLHLMLVIIFDDYLRLRDNLSVYFNASSQLFEKTQNAQIPNK
jgi:hypothetical protein